LPIVQQGGVEIGAPDMSQVMTGQGEPEVAWLGVSPLAGRVSQHDSLRCQLDFTTRSAN